MFKSDFIYTALICICAITESMHYYFKVNTFLLNIDSFGGVIVRKGLILSP